MASQNLRLPWGERLVYSVFHKALFAVMFWHLLLETVKHVFDPKHPLGKPLREGWMFHGVLRDMTDKKWSMWLHLLQEICLCQVIFFIISSVLQSIQPRLLRTAQVVMSLVAASLLHQPLSFLLCIIAFIIFHMLRYARSPVLVWTAAATAFFAVSLDSTVRGQHHPDQMFVYVAALTIARGTSLSLESCPAFGENRSDQDVAIAASRERKGEFDDVAAKSPEFGRTDASLFHVHSPSSASGGGLVEQLHYFFYLPLYFTGPVMTYNVFRHQLRRSADSGVWTPWRLVTSVRQCLGVLAWLLGCELLLQMVHLHFLSLSSTHRFLQGFQPATLLGLAFFLPQFKVMKYRVVFGLGRLAAALDGLQAPGGPVSPASVYYSTRMWKWFDTGIYQFLKRYVYLPMGGKEAAVVTRAMITVLCVFISALYIGRHSHSATWLLLTLAAAVLDFFIGHLTMERKTALTQVPPFVARVLLSLAHIPALVLVSMAFLALSASSQSLAVFFQKLFFPVTSVFPWLTLLFLHTCVQLGMDEERRLQQASKSS